jgi:4-amino-4-deoxy-L-arabinose transferase-like glycosyltransferase
MLDRLASAEGWLDRRPALRRRLVFLLLVPAVWQVAVMAWVVAGRVGFPLQLERLEGSQIYHAVRLLEGEALYRDAASGFLPHPYPPLHPLLTAAVLALFGTSYASARLLSVACFVAAAIVVSLLKM